MESDNKIGIMGGTFNPIHNGHIAIAKAAYEMLSLNKVLFMPSGRSYMKDEVLSPSQRVDMVARAISPFPYFELSTLEVDRAGNTYTSDTLQILTTEHPRVHYYFIMGADSLFHIETWKNPEIIFSLSTLVCAVRDEYNKEDLEQKRISLISKGADIILIDMPKINISSTNIRNYVKHKLPISDFVPEAVADYIKQEHLYE